MIIHQSDLQTLEHVGNSDCPLLQTINDRLSKLAIANASSSNAQGVDDVMDEEDALLEVLALANKTGAWPSEEMVSAMGSV